MNTYDPTVESARAYFKAKAKAQAKFPTVIKRREVLSKDKRSIRFLFANVNDILEVVQPILAEHGFSITFSTQRESFGENGIAFRSFCRMTHEEGFWEESDFTAPVVASAFMEITHTWITAQEYARRVALKNVTGVRVDDDLTDNDQAVSEDSAAQGRNDSPGQPQETTSKRNYAPPSSAGAEAPRSTLTKKVRDALVAQITNKFHGADSAENARDWCFKHGFLKSPDERFDEVGNPRASAITEFLKDAGAKFEALAPGETYGPYFKGSDGKATLEPVDSLQPADDDDIPF